MTKFVGNSITFPKLSAAPSSPVSGDTYYDTTFNKPFTYNGTEWVDLTLTSATTGEAGYWGSFWSTQDQSAANTTTAYPITFNNTDGDSSGVAIVSNSRVTFSYSGVYDIQFSAQADRVSGLGTDTIDIWFRKNGTDVPDSNTVVTVSGSANAAKTVAAWNYVVSVGASDYVELVWRASDTNLQLIADSAGTSPTRPAVPSVILTATQVMNTQQVELTNSTSTTSSTIAASATAVKSAYDLAASKLANISAGPGISVSGSGDSRQVSLESLAGSSSSGTPGTSFVKSLSADIYGRVLSYETGSVQNASTTAAGIVQLSDSISTTSSTLAATPTAVKSAYDLAATKVTSGGALGTPSSGTLTNATGLPISTGVSGLGSNVATFLATPSAANLASTVTEETGSGSLVFATSPTISNPTFSGTITGAGKTVNLVHGVTLQRTANLTINTSVDAAATAITWSSIVDESALYDYWSTGSTITLPETGWYSITCHVLFASGVSYAARLYCIVNGVIVAEAETQAGANTTADTIVLSTIVHAAATNTVVFRASASASSKVITGAGRTRCSVIYIGNDT